VAAAAVSAAVTGPVARADDHWVWTPTVTAGSDTDAGTVYADFSDSSEPTQNPVPFKGYVVAHSDGTVSCGTTGGPRRADGTADPGFGDDGQCHLTVDAG